MAHLKIYLDDVLTILEEGKDADMALIDDDFNVRHLIAMGQFMIKDGKMIKKGSYE